jgi:hypothetical protein
MVVKRTYIGMTGSSSRVNTRVYPPPAGHMETNSHAELSASV